MFKRELKYNLKSFLIWTVIIMAMYGVVFLVYPAIANSDQIQSMDELIAVFPKELLEAFNMDLASLSTMFGWLKSEGFVMLILTICAYAGILGSSILLKEENDKTIEYLNSLPITRTQIVLKKALVGLIYVVMMTILIAIFNYIGLLLSGDFDHKQYILMSLTPIMASIVIYSLCLFISTFTHKTKKTLGISLGIVFISFLFNTFSEINESVEWLKYFSAFTLADVRNVIINVSYNPYMILLSIGLTIGLLILSILRFKQKDLIS